MRSTLFSGDAPSLKPPSRENYREAIGLFERALALDPKSAEAQSRLASALVARVGDHVTDTVATDISRAEELVGHALMASARNPSAHYAKAQLLRVQRRFKEAIAEYETVIALNRNFVNAYAHLGRSKLAIGSIEETIPLQEQAVRLSPRDPHIGVWYYRIGLVHLLQSRTDEAILWLEKARNAGPRLPYVHAHLAAAYAHKDDSERAAASLADARRLAPEGEYSNIARARVGTRFEAQTIRALAEATFLAGLRKAGMPEE